MSSKTKPAATKEEATPALVPKLRFPEFRGVLGWEPKRLGLALKFQAGFPFPSSGFNDARKGLRLIRNRDLRSDDIVKFYSDDFDPNFVVNNGDVLVGMDGDFTPTVWEKGEALLNQRVGRILPRADNDHRFLLYLLTLCLKGIEEATARTTVKHLSHSAVEDKHEPLPSPPEQQKIAECLSSVDELIAAQARKLDALTTHKKGLMQQLFPREGETQPRLRFPEFQNAGEWEVKKLEDIGRVIRGASPRPKGDPRYYGGPVPRLMVQDVTRDGKWVTPQIDSLTEEGAQLSRPCPAGTLTIVCSGSVGVVSFLAVDACIHDGFLALVDIDESIATKDFLFHTLSTLREQFEKGATHGGVFTNLTTTSIDLFEIRRPEIPEQQRIASCLTSLDDLIAAQTQKHEALKTHKQGLMQQLFPSPEEVEV